MDATNSFCVAEFDDGVHLIPAKCLEIPNEDLASHKMKRIFSYRGNYQAGKTKVKLAAKRISDLKSDNVEKNISKKKRKARSKNKRLARALRAVMTSSSSSSEEEEEEEDDDDDDRIDDFTEPTPVISRIDDNFLSLSENLPTQQSKDSVQDGFASLNAQGQSADSFSKKMTINTPGRSESSTPKSTDETDTVRPVTSSSNCQEFHEKYLRKLNMIYDMVKGIENRLDAIIDHKKEYQVKDEGHINSFPMQTQEEMDELELKLEEDSYFQYCVKTLMKIGGHNLQSCVCGIMKNLMTDDIAEMYSLQGRKHKKSLQSLYNIHKLILATVQLQKNKTDAEINPIIARWLVQAAARLKRLEERKVSRAE